MTREEALEWFIERKKMNLDDKCQQAEDVAIKALEQEPKTGHWTKSKIGGAKVCSVCKAHMGLSNFNFCPNCGARMKGDKHD